MYKNELIYLVASKTGISHSNVEIVLDAFTEITAETLTRGDPVVISGFGVFEPKSRSPRIGRNPHTGEPVNIPARILPNFKPSQALKDRVSGSATNSLRDSPAK